MNAICAAGARTAAERVATTPAPLKAGAWKGSRRYIICGDRGGCQTSRSVEDFCLHVRPERGLLPWPPFRRRLIKLVGMHIQLAGLNRKLLKSTQHRLDENATPRATIAASGRSF